MDGDGVSNSDEHNKITLGPDGKYDTDGDGTEDDLDDDDDNDGMKDAYEQNHGISNGGWQDPLVYNARYALLIGGGGTMKKEDAESGNFPAFWNDAEKFYNKLVNDYKYVPENVYLLSSKWYVKHGDNYVWEGHDKTTDTIVDGECQWDNASAFDIKDAIEEIGERTTVNDLIILVNVAHGGEHGFSIVPTHTTPEFRGALLYYNTLSDKINNTLGGAHGQARKYAMMITILQSCQSGDGAKLFEMGENRVGISAAKVDELSYTQMGTLDHWAFLYKGRHRDGLYQDTYYNGFILSLGTASSPQSIKYAFNCGYTAATNNHFDGNWIDPAEHYDSHPRLYADGNGIPNEASDKDVVACIYL